MVITVGTLIYSIHSNAACIQNPSHNLMRYIPNETITLQYDDIQSNGSILKSITVTGHASEYHYSINDGANVVCGGYLQYYFASGWSANSSNIAPTNITGIGVKVRYRGIYLPYTGSKTWSSYSYPSPTYWTVDIVKTGQLGNSGTIKSGVLAYSTQYNTEVGTRFIGTILNFQSNYRINVLSCSLKNSQSVYNIELGDWYDTQFANMGDTSTAVDIPITLTCMSGANIKATITSSAGYVDVNTGKLALSGADKATGIAIQLLDKNSVPIKLNTKNSLQNSVPAGDYMFNWKARYIKTADKITPGSANSTATVNIRYE